MTPIDDIQRWTIIWVVVALYLIVRHWRAGRNVGLVLGYIVCFGAIDLFAAALCLLPWSPATGLQLVADGTELSAIGVAAFAVGAEIVSWLMSRRPEPEGEVRTIDQRVLNIYLVTGLFLHVAMAPIARTIPTVNALVGGGSALAVLAIALKCWNAWHEGRRGDMWWWLVASCLFPVFTVVTQGFLGYGLSAMLLIVAFVAAMVGPRPKVIAVSLLLAYGGLSVYVTYMRDRSEIRSVVWAGRGFADQLSAVRETATSVEPFDIYNEAHLRRIDDRLNQNWLVGAAVAKLSSGTIGYAKGSTLWDAVLAILPRALWPDKPVAAGSGDLVSTYTGLRFGNDTSVGIGQLMECYVNFGTAGVVIGFFIIGAFATLVDRSAVRHLRSGQAGHFLLWYLPGVNLLNVGGSFVDASSSAAAALVVALIIQFVVPRLIGDTEPGTLADLTPDGPVQRYEGQ